MWGLNPRVADYSPLATASTVTDGGARYLAITFSRRHKALDVTCTVETSDDLNGPWTPTTTDAICELKSPCIRQTAHQTASLHRARLPEPKTSRLIRKAAQRVME